MPMTIEPMPEAIEAAPMPSAMSLSPFGSVGSAPCCGSSFESVSISPPGSSGEPNMPPSG